MALKFNLETPSQSLEIDDNIFRGLFQVIKSPQAYMAKFSILYSYKILLCISKVFFLSNEQ